MKTIYKYSVHALDMPIGAKILSVQMQDGRIVLWAEVDPDVATEPCVFEVFGTGQQMTDTNRQYIGTVQDGPMVWHIYRRQV